MELQDLAGIYCLITPNKGIYVGQAVDLYKRISRYKGLHCKNQSYLYNSLKKYGFENCKVEFLFTCKRNDFDKHTLKDLLNDLEMEFILVKNSFRDLNPKGMNLTTGGGVCVYSESTKAKISATLKISMNRPEVKSKLSKSLKISQNRPEVKAKISANSKSNRPEVKAKISAFQKGKKRSELTKYKISEAKKGNNNPSKRPEVIAKANATKQAKKLQKYDERVQRLKKLDMSVPLQVEKISGVQSVLF